MTTKTRTYNIAVPFSSMMSFDIQLEEGLTDEQVIQQVKSRHLELVDFPSISVLPPDEFDLNFEIDENDACDFIINEEAN